jgi:hypothetical protein
LFSQSIKWQRSYNSQFNLSDYGDDVCEADGDNFYIAGYTTVLPNSNHIYIMKFIT